jgi:predicted nucleic acid-binding protein
MDFAVVIDSCVFIEYFRSKNKENTLLTKLNRQRRAFYVSAVAKYEVLAGAQGKDMHEWQQIFEDVTVLPFDEAAIDTARTIFRQLKQENKMVSLGDILIAATAMANDLPLATLNQNHFERIQGLRMV